MNHNHNLVSLPSIRALQLYGIPKSQLLHTMLTLQSVSSDLVDDCMDEYYLLYASPEHFLKNSHCGIYYRKDSQYVIVYATPQTTRGKILDSVGKSVQLSLSFRTAKPEYNLPSYVLVSIQTSTPSQFKLNVNVEVAV